MDLNAIDVLKAEMMFSLAVITSVRALEKAREVGLNKATDDQIFPTVDFDDKDVDDINMERDEHGEVVA